MAVRFQDFVPRVSGSKEVLFFTVADYESFDKAVDAAGAWIEAREVDVVNIETVVLPNMHIEEGSTDSDLRSSGDMSTSWYQFVRVWYRYDGSGPPPRPPES